MKKWLVISVTVIAAVVTFYLRQEHREQPALAAEPQRSSVNPDADLIPVPLQASNPMPSEQAGLDAPLPQLPHASLNTDSKYSSEKKVATIHSAWDAEIRDPVWAPAMEDTWHNFYSGNSDLVALGMPVIECKKTLCEVRVSAYGNQESMFHGMLMPRSPKNTQQLTLPKGTQLGATSWIVVDQPGQLGVAAEYMVFMTFMREDVSVHPVQP